MSRSALGARCSVLGARYLVLDAARQRRRRRAVESSSHRAIDLSNPFTFTFH
ncbi:hypothetical protein BURPS668_A2139 [Burkholderia pseudomallei 668]|nr:hypothetical protein BURPS668_A2139 [Burkholderia pseudomallei 668]